MGELGVYSSSVAVAGVSTGMGIGWLPGTGEASMGVNVAGGTGPVLFSGEPPADGLKATVVPSLLLTLNLFQNCFLAFKVSCDTSRVSGSGWVGGARENDGSRGNASRGGNAIAA